MWGCRFDDPATKRVAFGEGATIDVLTEETPAQLAAIRVTVAPGARVGEHDHGGSDALLLPLAGRLTLRDRDGELQLAPGAMAFVAGGERVSVENSSDAPASMVVCFAPPTFVTALLATSGRDAMIKSLEAAKATPA